ncbi:MAG: VOC family protein [Candidatus Eisenbacteria bacterium]|nr:VOC family protein [Candidatus Eisenbacteria bacterium]
MAPEAPQVPAGSGKHPITLVVIAANQLDASIAFYSKVFGWTLHKVSAELAGGMPAHGPAFALRTGVPEGSPSAVAYVLVPDVKSAMKRAIETGATEERAPWSIPLVGMLARFTTPGGTVWGVTTAQPPAGTKPVPMPFGDAPKPPAGTICSVEMYAPDGEAAGKWFAEHFGWGWAPSMPQFVAFDPGAGIGGVFQSHTPQAPVMIYVYATDVVAKVAEIEAAGGKRIGEPMPVPGMGCFGYFQDPSGTVMGLIGG